MLKFVELLNTLELKYKTPVGGEGMFQGLMRNATNLFNASAIKEDISRCNEELGHCFSVYNLIADHGVELLDEVDLILHPLKSELNWPLGEKLPLDLGVARSPGSQLELGMRWKVPFILIDAILAANPKDPQKVTNSDLAKFSKAEEAKNDIAEALTAGFADRLLQSTPHIILLDKEFYKARIMPPLARWAVVWLRTHITKVSDDIIEAFLLHGNAAPAEVIKKIRDEIDDEEKKLLNLTRQHLTIYIPHCFSKINRVTFGLLSADDLERAMKRGRVPKNRKLLAVPFVALDLPSEASEFSNPEVVIGLSTLAYRLAGLRKSDFIIFLRQLHEDMTHEQGPHKKRPSVKRYNKYVEAAGGRVRGTQEIEEKKDEEEEEYEHNHIPPLFMLDFTDEEQMNTLFGLLHKLGQVVQDYLNDHVFPDTMKFQKQKLSASGQEVGGEILFKHRMGFSGTPSDLLPVEFMGPPVPPETEPRPGRCFFEPGDEAKMLKTLTDPTVMGVYKFENQWNVEALLNHVATGGYHAFIDCGALITGQSNLEVIHTSGLVLHTRCWLCLSWLSLSMLPRWPATCWSMALMASPAASSSIN